jgi:hypothetical protein
MSQEHRNLNSLALADDLVAGKVDGHVDRRRVSGR